MFEQMKGLTPKKKVEYYLEYYGWRTAGVLAVIFLAVFLLVHFTASKEYVTGILAVNARGEQKKATSSEYFDDFLIAWGRDPAEETILVDCELYVKPDEEDQVTRENMQRVQTLFTTQAIDVFLADEEFFLAIAQSGYLADLSGYLPDAVMEKRREDLVYVTVAETGEEILAGITVYPQEKWMQDTGWYSEPAVIGVAAVMKDEELALGLFMEAVGQEK